jgi:hypothetical protein
MVHKVLDFDDLSLGTRRYTREPEARSLEAMTDK